jgi:hypothetical protein
VLRNSREVQSQAPLVVPGYGFAVAVAIKALTPSNPEALAGFGHTVALAPRSGRFAWIAMMASAVRQSVHVGRGQIARSMRLGFEPLVVPGLSCLG